MRPYRIKHKPTGLYYKPGAPSLSKLGKVYTTRNNILTYTNGHNFVYIVVKGRPRIQEFDRLGYPISLEYRQKYNFKVIYKVPKTEFEMEYIEPDMKNRYIVVQWPDIQDLMDEPGFEDNASLINDERFYQLYGDSAYFVNEEWYNKVMSHGE